MKQVTRVGVLKLLVGVLLLNGAAAVANIVKGGTYKITNNSGLGHHNAKTKKLQDKVITITDIREFTKFGTVAQFSYMEGVRKQTASEKKHILAECCKAFKPPPVAARSTPSAAPAAAPKPAQTVLPPGKKNVPPTPAKRVRTPSPKCTECGQTMFGRKNLAPFKNSKDEKIWWHRECAEEHTGTEDFNERNALLRAGILTVPDAPKFGQKWQVAVHVSGGVLPYKDAILTVTNIADNIVHFFYTHEKTSMKKYGSARTKVIQYKCNPYVDTPKDFQMEIGRRRLLGRLQQSRARRRRLLERLQGF